MDKVPIPVEYRVFALGVDFLGSRKRLVIWYLASAALVAWTRHPRGSVFKGRSDRS